MLRKRIIYTLLYDDGYFIQSRNFRRQKIGKADWVNKNYRLDYISNFIDELIILDISKKKNYFKFINEIQKITKRVFAPISLGGGINNLEKVNYYFNNGADKVVINTAVFENSILINKIAKLYGSQSIILSIDVKKIKSQHIVFINNGRTNTETTIENYIKKISNLMFAEIFLNSIDKDGTGNGVDKAMINKIRKFDHKYIISGGCGNYNHFYDAFKCNKKVEAVSTANLLNFVGEGLKIVRKNLLYKKINLSPRVETFDVNR